MKDGSYCACPTLFRPMEPWNPSKGEPEFPVATPEPTPPPKPEPKQKELQPWEQPYVPLWVRLIEDETTRRGCAEAFNPSTLESTAQLSSNCSICCYGLCGGTTTQFMTCFGYCTQGKIQDWYDQDKKR
jgi:hypothetical protein